MKTLFKPLVGFTLLLFALWLPMIASAKPFFTITATPMTLNVARGQTADVTVTVTNNSGRDIPGGITYNANLTMPSSLFTTNLFSNSCSSALSNAQSCSFVDRVQAANTVGSALLAPAACFLGNCSSLAVGHYVNVNVIAVEPSPFISIAVTPASNTIVQGHTQQYTAIGTLLDGSTKDITASVTWSSSSTSVATIGTNTGLATAVGVGSTFITAGLGTTTSNTITLTVRSAFAYVANSDPSVGVRQCTVNTDGTLNFCNSVLDAGGPSGSTLNPAGTFLYLGSDDSGATTVNVCTVNTSNGELSSCGTTTGYGFDIPTNIAFNPAGTFAYIASVLLSSITKCTANSNTGVLSDCAATGLTFFDFPWGITVNPAGTFAYIAIISDSIHRCVIDPNDGSFSSCIATGTGITSSRGIALNTAGSIAYVVDGASLVYKCTVDSNDGTLNSCHPTATDSTFNGTYGIALNAANTFAYVSNSYSWLVSRCDISPATGELSNCISTGTGFMSPEGIALN